MTSPTKNSAPVGVDSNLFPTALTPGKYVVRSSVAAWVAVGANPTACARVEGSTYVPADVPTEIVAQDAGDRAAIIRDAVGETAAGDATLTRATS